MLYRLLDKIFDPPPKGAGKAGAMLYYDSQDKGYKRYKRLCYRNLILETALAFVLGFLIGPLVQF